MNMIARHLTFGKVLFSLAAIAMLVTIFLLILLLGVWFTWGQDEVEIFTRNQLVINLLVIALISAGIGLLFLFTGLRWRGRSGEVVSQRQLNDVLRERVSSLSEQTHSQSRKEPEYPDGLTEREVEVMRSIATGKTDRQVGDELFITRKTVGNHVSKILSKIGANNRIEVTTYAIRHNLA